MITKQQALEFLYELSQKTDVKIDIPCGCISINEDFGIYHSKFEQEDASFEELVTGLIKESMDTELIKDLDKIPVDTGMLEVGEIYEVHDSYCDGFDNWITSKFTSKFLSLGEFNPNGYYNINFEDGYVNTLHYIEIYKVKGE